MSSLKILGEENKQHDEIYLNSDQVDARRKFQYYSGIMGTDAR